MIQRLAPLGAVLGLGWVGILPGGAIAADPPSSPLPDPYQAVLETLEIGILIPSTLPEGFHLAKFEVEPCLPDTPRSETGTCRFGPSYRIIYRHANASCFAVEAVGGGIGGPAFAYSFPVKTDGLGTIPIFFGEQSAQTQPATLAQQQSPQSNIHSEWIGSGPFYRVTTVLANGALPCSQPLTPAQVGQVVTALDWMQAP